MNHIDTMKQATDSKWYWVRYEGLGKTYEAPALYRENAKAFYSVEFSGIPAREVEVLCEYPPAQRKPLTDEEMDNCLRRAGVIATIEALRCIGREVEAAHGIAGEKK